MPTRIRKAHPETIERFQSYLDGLGQRLRDKRQRESFAMYALDPAEQSMEPIAARACADLSVCTRFTSG